MYSQSQGNFNKTNFSPTLLSLLLGNHVLWHTHRMHVNISKQAKDNILSCNGQNGSIIWKIEETLHCSLHLKDNFGHGWEICHLSDFLSVKN